MKFLFFFFIFFSLLFQSFLFSQEAPYANPLTVDISRRLTKELLGPNSTPFMQPLVTVSNAASNSRFFRQAYIPSHVTKPYFKFGIHSMLGFVRDDQKTYTPIAPRATMNEVLSDTSVWSVNLTSNSIIIKDTAGLVVDILKYLVNKGLGVDSSTSGMSFPKTAATVFGFQDGRLVLSNDYFIKQLKGGDPMLSLAFSKMNPAIQDTILNAVTKLPSNLALPTGGNVNSIIAAIPQFEIGSLYGTELLIRLIPPVEFDKNVGKFAFWGVGVKHSISQYFTNNDSENRPWCDMALQSVYQGTSLTKSVGVTNAQLTSNATIFDVNFHASKSFKGLFDIYTGISYENITINSSFEYFLPVELQMQLGLLRHFPVDTVPFAEPEKGYPGDTKPQTVSSTLKDTNVKWIVGLAKEIGPVAIFFDYSMSKFNIFTGGIELRF